MVIDALRVDHVFTNEALNTTRGFRELVKGLDGPKIPMNPENSQAFVAKVHMPTVTMPRIKAMISGTVPGMGDMIANFNSQEMIQDNLIKIWTEKNRTLTFFGDDTWIRLFPNSFVRSEGTHSFFVNDITEVDANVTRHLDEELTVKNDWDVMILHYLGLDHIGHTVGPKSYLVSQKLDEMTKVIERIQHSLFSKPYRVGKPPLLVVSGDHGMADEGGHGGSSFSETNTPIIFISPIASTTGYRKVHPIKQQDLAPTLALLTGVRIPSTSIGVAIGDVLSRFCGKDLAEKSRIYNGEQLAENLRSNLGEDVAKDEGYQQFLISRSKGQKVDLAVEKMVSRLEESLAKFNMEWVVLGITLLVLTLLATFVVFDPYHDPPTFVLIFFHFARILSYASTSFIEEEHQAVYFTTITIICMITTAKAAKRSLIAILTLGILRRWNQTGDKWSHLPDVADFLMERKSIMSGVHVLSLVLVVVLKVKKRNGWLCNSLYLLALAMTYLQKSAQGHIYEVVRIFEEKDPIPSRIIYALAIAILFLSVHGIKANHSTKYSEGCAMFLVPVLLALSQPKNTAILLGGLLVEETIQDIIEPTSVEFKTLLYYNLGFFLYFCQVISFN